jgi:predicted methyltransferase
MGAAPRRTIGSTFLALPLALGTAWAQHASPPAHEPAGDHARATQRFDDASKWAGIWDHPSRDTWQAPDTVVAFLELAPGMSVADIGAGTGYFNPHLSRAVGATGVVYAADVESTLVRHMRERATREGTPNVRPLLAAMDDPRLPAAVDRILLVDAYHHIDGRVGYFRRLQRRLNPGGRLIVVDWKQGKLPLGPAESHKMAAEEIIAELDAAGWRLLARDALAYQYMLAFEPDPAGP